MTSLSPREIVRLYKELDPDPAILFDATRSRELLDSPEVKRVVSGGPRTGTLNPQDSLLRNLQCLAVFDDRESEESNGVDLVGTFPGGFDSGARSLRMVIREMLNAAKNEVVVLGYEVTDEDFLASVARIATRCDVVFVVDRGQGSVRKIRKTWPDAIPQEPVILVNASRENEARYAKMHSKGLIVDGNDLLISSANLTFHGFSGNIELGLRTQGDAASRLRNLIGGLIRQGILERSH